MTLKTSVTDTLTPGLNKLFGKYRPSAKRAGSVAALAAYQDMIHEPPTPPIDTGHLRGAGFAYVMGEKILDGGQAFSPSGIPSDRGKIEIGVGINTPYARYQHEGLAPGPGVVYPKSGKVVHLEPGPKSQQAGDVGGQFLAIKLNRNRMRYIGIFSDRFKKFLFGGGA